MDLSTDVRQIRDKALRKLGANKGSIAESIYY